MQQTLNTSVTCQSVGVHSGKTATMTLRPAPVDSGIVFVRNDVQGVNPVIPALWNKVIDTKLCTVIANEDGVKVSTIEHVMSALLGLGVDNAIIEIDNEEVPIMDGSAKEFVALIQQAGIQQQNKARRKIVIKKTVTFEDDGKVATLSPAKIPTYSFEIDFSEKNTLIGKQNFSMQMINGNYMHDIAAARTFGLLEEVEYLKSIGLARGGSLDNAIVVNKDQIMNPDGLRFDNEFVRHKILDAIGDLYLAGAPIIGHFDGIKAGHAMNNQILHTLFADPDAWAYEDELKAA